MCYLLYSDWNSNIKHISGDERRARGIESQNKQWDKIYLYENGWFFFSFSKRTKRRKKLNRKKEKQKKAAWARHFWTGAANRMAIINSHYSFYCSRHTNTQQQQPKKIDRKNNEVERNGKERVNPTMACQASIFMRILCACWYIYIYVYICIKDQTAQEWAGWRDSKKIITRRLWVFWCMEWKRCLRFAFFYIFIFLLCVCLFLFVSFVWLAFYVVVVAAAFCSFNFAMTMLLDIGKCINVCVRHYLGSFCFVCFMCLCVSVWVRFVHFSVVV